MTMLQGSGISVSFGGRKILDKVDLSVKPGEMIALLGPNGAGKTTLLRTMAGLQQCEEGQILFQGQSLGKVPKTELAQKLAYLAQGANCQWPLKVERVVALGRIPHLPSRTNIQEQDCKVISEALQRADVAHLVGRTVTTLSGGERTRVMLARALASEPQILLADEPVAALDPLHQIEVMSLMGTIAHTGASVVVVLHDLNLALQYCDRIVLLHEGKIAADNAPENVLTEEMLQKVYGIKARFVESEGDRWILPKQR